MQALLTLPSGPLAEACVSLARTTESAAIFDHSIRSFLYARLLAEREGSLADAAYDEGLLFAACILHDLGLGSVRQAKLGSRSRAPTWLPLCSASAEWPPA